MTRAEILKRQEEIEAQAAEYARLKLIYRELPDDVFELCQLARKLLAVAEAARELKYRLGVGYTVVIDLEALTPLANALAVLED